MVGNYNPFFNLYTSAEGGGSSTPTDHDSYMEAGSGDMFIIKGSTIPQTKDGVTYSFGDADNEYEADVSKAILEVRMEGHGKSQHKKKLIFPKLVFIHDKEKHSEGKEFEYLFNLAIKCSSENMYPKVI